MPLAARLVDKQENVTCLPLRRPMGKGVVMETICSCSPQNCKLRGDVQAENMGSQVKQSSRASSQLGPHLCDSFRNSSGRFRQGKATCWI